MMRDLFRDEEPFGTVLVGISASEEFTQDRVVPEIPNHRWFSVISILKRSRSFRTYGFFTLRSETKRMISRKNDKVDMLKEQKQRTLSA